MVAAKGRDGSELARRPGTLPPTYGQMNLILTVHLILIVPFELIRNPSRVVSEAVPSVESLCQSRMHWVLGRASGAGTRQDVRVRTRSWILTVAAVGILGGAG